MTISAVIDIRVRAHRGPVNATPLAGRRRSADRGPGGCGSIGLVRTLMEHDLVDELRLLVSADLKFDRDGLVRGYPGLTRRVAPQSGAPGRARG
jgi:hypothetical protein